MIKNVISGTEDHLIVRLRKAEENIPRVGELIKIGDPAEGTLGTFVVEQVVWDGVIDSNDFLNTESAEIILKRLHSPNIWQRELQKGESIDIAPQWPAPPPSRSALPDTSFSSFSAPPKKFLSEAWGTLFIKKESGEEDEPILDPSGLSSFGGVAESDLAAIFGIEGREIELAAQPEPVAIDFIGGNPPTGEVMNFLGALSRVYESFGGSGLQFKIAGLELNLE